MGIELLSLIYKAGIGGVRFGIRRYWNIIGHGHRILPLEQEVMIILEEAYIDNASPVTWFKNA